VNQNEFQDWEIRSNMMPACFQGRNLLAKADTGEVFLGGIFISLHHSVWRIAEVDAD
jgi:hypothetical protein